MYTFNMMPTNDSTLALESFLAALLRQHVDESSCVDKSMDDRSSSTPIKVDLIFDNCAIHQTKRVTLPKSSNECNLRTKKSFEDRQVASPALPCHPKGEKRDTSPLMPRAATNRKSRSRSEEKQYSNEIPKQSLVHQSSTRPYHSCAEAAAVAAAVHCKSRWSSSPIGTPLMMREPSRDPHHQLPFPMEHNVLHGRQFPNPPHPAIRQVSVDRDNCGAGKSSAHGAIVLGDPSQVKKQSTTLQGQQHVPNSLPIKDCNNVIALVDQALQAITTSFPEPVPCDRRKPYDAMKCHQPHSLVPLAEKKCWH